MVSESQFEFLRSIDTPTVCNLIEIVAPERRGAGYTVRAPALPVPRPAADGRLRQDRDHRAPTRCRWAGRATCRSGMDYLDYVAAAPRPSVVVIEDIDEPAGYGAFWGEVQTNVHKALGCLGTVTNGSIRDIPQVAPRLPDAGRLDRAVARLRARRRVRRSRDHPRHGGEERRPHPRRPPRRRRRAGRQDRRDASRRSTA